MILPSLTLAICTNAMCERPYLPKVVGAKFCPRCEGKVRSAKREAKAPTRKRNLAPQRECAAPDCSLKFAPRSGTQRFHSVRCRERTTKREQRDAQRKARVEELVKTGDLEAAYEVHVKSEANRRGTVTALAKRLSEVSSHRDSDDYRRFVDSGLALEVHHGKLSQADVTAALGTDKKNVSVWMRWFRDDVKVAEERASWQMDPDALASLLVGDALTY